MTCDHSRTMLLGGADTTNRYPSRALLFSFFLLFLAIWTYTSWIVLPSRSNLRKSTSWPWGFNFDEPTFISECLHPMGGGHVRAGGMFPALNDSFLSPECTLELRDYFAPEDGQYLVDVARVAEQARRHFEDLSDLEPPSPKKLIIFDIDETTLSNAEEWRNQLMSHWTPPPKHGSSRRHLLTSDALTPPRGLVLRKTPVGASDRPPLAPMLGLYHYFYTSGFSVAFITGRDEAARNSTAVNLKAAGYGSLCPHANDLKQRMKQDGLSSDLAAVIDPNAPSVNYDEFKGLGGPGKACYMALHLREIGDTRLASVYKPERRAALERDGFIVYGNFGDQFSDLDGTMSAPNSFKLPNPAYLIL